MQTISICTLWRSSIYLLSETNLAKLIQLITGKNSFQIKYIFKPQYYHWLMFENIIIVLYSPKVKTVKCEESKR